VAAKRSPERTSQTLRLAPLQQVSTPTLVAEQLREAIASGEFAPGQQLLEASLAQALGVSRGPLREAMQRLTQEGLLISRRNRGLFVTDLDEASVRDTFLARGVVERGAVEHLIASGRNGAAEALVEIANRMDQYRTEPTSEEISLVDLAFHEKLVELSESPELQRMHRTLLTRLRMCLTNMRATYASVDERMGEHRMLAEAIIAGDTERATKLLRDHMDDGLQRLLANVPGGARSGRESARS
jgi:DNA-binding GntR family transcriptional regulator